MGLLKAMIRLEWYRLIRSRIMIGSLAAFVLIALLAIRTGHGAIQHRLVQLDSIRAVYDQDFEAQLKKITDTSAAGRKRAAIEGLAAVVNYRLPQNALLYPQALQAFSIGVSDIQPFYHQVQTAVSYLDPPNIPVTNPMRLFAGNFDLAFVWLYILPLLIMGLCYPIYGEEKEAGTLMLLGVQSGSLRRIMVYKLLFRALITSLLVLLLNITGFVFIPGKQGGADQQFGWWCLVTQLYLLAWYSISWMVVSFRLNSALTALLLTVCWLLAVIILPAITNIYVAARYPVPLRNELASLQRHESEKIWSMNARSLTDSFNAAHPQYAYSSNPVKDTMRGSTRFFAGYYYLLEKRVSKAAAVIDSQVAQRNRCFARLAAADPVLVTQQLFNQLAGTSLQDYQHYRQQVAAFQQQWKAFLYPWQLAENPLGYEQFQQFPVFTMPKKKVGAKQMMISCSLLYALFCIPALAGYILFNRKEKR